MSAQAKAIFSYRQKSVVLIENKNKRKLGKRIMFKEVKSKQVCTSLYPTVLERNIGSVNPKAMP